MAPEAVTAPNTDPEPLTPEEIFEVARERYDAAFEAYAQRSAALNQGEGFGEKPGRLGQLWNKFLYGPGPTPQDAARIAHAEKAQHYHEALNTLTDAMMVPAEKPGYTRRATRLERVDMRLEAQLSLENRITQLREEATGRRDPQTGEIQYTSRQRMGKWVAETWLRHNSDVKAALVAVPAAAVGIGLGVGAVVAAPALGVMGVGALLAGKAIGGVIARTVDKYAIATETGKKAHEDAVIERLALMENSAKADLARAQKQHRAFDPKNIDVVKVIEAATATQAKVNARRRESAERVGMVAAVLSFGGVGLVHGVAAGAAAGHNTVASVSNANNNVSHLTARNATGSTVRHISSSMQPASSLHNVAPWGEHVAINPATYPWNVANQLQVNHLTGITGSPMDVINHFIQVHNAMPGSDNYAFHTLASGKVEIAKIVHGVAHPLTASEQLGFNNLMIQASHAQQAHQAVAMQRVAQAVAA